MKRHVCKRCGKERWARTVGKGTESRPLQSVCKRCLIKEHGPDWRRPRQKRVKRKRQGGKPSGRKGRKADGSSRQK